MPTINPLSALSNLGEANTARNAIANDFDTFLTLLTTQLQNQNPLEPLDTNQFTQQLVQFSEVEQTIKSNENLENLLKLQAATAVTNSVGYIGKTVELASTTQELKNGTATWPLVAENPAQNATFTVKDSDGNLIFAESKPIEQGASDYQWNGKDNDGNNAPAGSYTLSVEATSASGVAVNVNIASSGTVDGVDLSGDTLYLLINGQKVKLENVTTIRQ